MLSPRKRSKVNNVLLEEEEDVTSEEKEEEEEYCLDNLPYNSPNTLISPISFESHLNQIIKDKYESYEKLEKSKQITDGNYILQKKHVSIDAKKISIQTIIKAQYGRARIPFVSQVVQVANILSTDRVVDIGSGIGTVVLQLGLTIGCFAYGVELCLGRHEAAISIFDTFQTQIPNNTNFNKIHLAHGDFREIKHFEICKTADVLFVNNAESIFSGRSAKLGHTLDWHVARAACGMKKGSRIVTFEALHDLEKAPTSSCFNVQVFSSEKGATSWTETSMKSTKFHVYTKIEDNWICNKCNIQNPLIRPSNSEWKESILDSCITCREDPNGFRGGYYFRRSKSDKS